MKPLTASPNPAAVNQSILINGSGFRRTTSNTLHIVVWGSPVLVSATAKSDGTFTGTTTIPLAGNFQAVAYQVRDYGGLKMNWTELGQVTIEVQ